MFLVIAIAAISCGKTSANGSDSTIEFTTYSDTIRKPVPRNSDSEDMLLYNDYTVIYNVKWPIKGDEKTVKELQEWIKYQLLGDKSSAISTLDFNQIINKYAEDFFNECISEEGFFRADITIDGEADSPFEGLFQMTYSCEKFDIGFHTHYTTNQIVIDTNDGKVFPISTAFTSPLQVRKLIIKHLDADYGDLFESRDNLPMPKNKPLLKKDGIEFYYVRYEITHGGAGMPRSIVPYEEILPYLSDEARAFFPKSLTDKIAKAPETNELTEEMAAEMWDKFLNDDDSQKQLLSKSFHNMIDIVSSIPNDVDGILFDWHLYGGQEFLPYDKLECVRIRETDNPNITRADIVLYRPNYTNSDSSYDIEFILEEMTDSNGKHHKEWKINDFSEDNKGSKRNETYNCIVEYGLPFVYDNYAEKILNDPDYSDFLDDEYKAKYRKEVADFIAKFKKTYPDGKVVK